MLMVCRGSVNAPTISARYSTRWIRYVVEKKCVYTHLSTRTYGRMYTAGDSVHRGITCMHGPPSTATAVTRQPS